MKKALLFLLVVVSMLSGLAGATLSNLFFTRQAVATSAPDQIMAREFVMVDENYTPRAILKMADKGPALVLTDPDQKIKVLLQGYGPSGEIFLAGQDGKIRLKLGERDSEGIGLRLYGSGRTVRSSFILRDWSPELYFNYPSGKPAVAMGIENDDSANIILKGAKSETRAGILAGNHQSTLFMTDEKGTPRTGLVYNNDKGAAITFANADGIHRFSAGLPSNEGPYLNMKSIKNGYSLHLTSSIKGSFLAVSQEKDGKSADGVMGLNDNMSWLTLRNSLGGKFDVLFSEFGQPYLLVADQNRKLWSAPSAAPPGIREIRHPRPAGMKR